MKLAAACNPLLMIKLIAFQLFQNVHGVINCGSAKSEVCLTATNTFLCDQDADDCVMTTFSGVEGTSSLCKGVAEAPPVFVCSNMDVVFNTQKIPHGMTCDGPGACSNSNFLMSREKGIMTCKGGTVDQWACRSFAVVATSMNCEGPAACSRFDANLNQENGILTCKGGTDELPACEEMDINAAGCLICSGRNSCKQVSFRNADGEVEQYPGLFQGSLGLNCPIEEKKSALPTCFSGSNTVEVRGRGIIPIDIVSIGDFVKTGIDPNGQSRFSRVLCFMHLDRNAELNFLQIFSNGFPRAQPLEISGGHFLYLNNDKVVRAQDIRIGDILKGDTIDMVVTRIESIQRRGLYAPVTEDGILTVSGVTASSYVSILPDTIVSPNRQVQVYHITLSPLRIVCGSILGDFSVCQNEAYTEHDGYSTNLWILIDVGLYVWTWMYTLQLLALIVLFPLLLGLTGLEVVVDHGLWSIVSVVIGFTILYAFSKANMITKTFGNHKVDY
jgi:hypothetical protein